MVVLAAAVKVAAGVDAEVGGGGTETVVMVFVSVVKVAGAGAGDHLIAGVDADRQDVQQHAGTSPHRDRRDRRDRHAVSHHHAVTGADQDHPGRGRGLSQEVNAYG